MIAKNHPVLDALEALPWECHLIGSRFVGKHYDASDYDFLLAAKLADGQKGMPEERMAIDKALTAAGFTHEPGCYGYGPDRLLWGIYRWKAKDGFVQVDVLVAGAPEAARRLAFFEMQKVCGHDDGGKLALALKNGEAWPTLWRVLKYLEGKVGEKGGEKAP